MTDLTQSDSPLERTRAEAGRFRDALRVPDHEHTPLDVLVIAVEGIIAGSPVVVAPAGPAALSLAVAELRHRLGYTDGVQPPDVVG